MSNTTVYMSDLHYKRLAWTYASVGLILVLGASIATWILVGLIAQMERSEGRKQCDEIAKNSSYVTKFTGKTCWIRINDGADGVTSEAWIPSEWMTMG